LKDRIAYRIVDEYPENGPYYRCRPRTSRQPLTLRELVEMIDGACEDEGAAFGPIIGNIRLGGDPLEDQSFVSVRSEFYSDLHAYYEARFAVYFDSFRNADDNALPDAAAPASSKATLAAVPKPGEIEYD
jgi:hypothetical protein